MLADKKKMTESAAKIDVIVQDNELRLKVSGYGDAKETAIAFVQHLAKMAQEGGINTEIIDTRRKDG